MDYLNGKLLKLGKVYVINMGTSKVLTLHKVFRQAHADFFFFTTLIMQFTSRTSWETEGLKGNFLQWMLTFWVTWRTCLQQDGVFPWSRDGQLEKSQDGRCNSVIKSPPHFHIHCIGVVGGRLGFNCMVTAAWPYNWCCRAISCADFSISFLFSRGCTKNSNGLRRSHLLIIDPE